MVQMAQYEFASITNGGNSISKMKLQLDKQETGELQNC